MRTSSITPDVREVSDRSNGGRCRREGPYAADRLLDFFPGGSSSVGRAAAFQAACREFEPRLPLQQSLTSDSALHPLQSDRVSWLMAGVAMIGPLFFTRPGWVSGAHRSTDGRAL